MRTGDGGGLCKRLIGSLGVKHRAELAAQFCASTTVAVVRAQSQILSCQAPASLPKLKFRQTQINHAIAMVIIAMVTND